MKTSRLCAVVLTTFLACLPLAAQQIVDWISGDTLPPLAMAANPVAHKIYVADGLLFTGGTTINVINEQDDGITDVNVGNYPIAIGVNSATGSAYVLNYTDHGDRRRFEQSAFQSHSGDPRSGRGGCEYGYEQDLCWRVSRSK